MNLVTWKETEDGVIAWTHSQMVFFYLKVFTYCVYVFAKENDT